MHSNISGSNNTASGYHSLYSNNSGNNNIAIGQLALGSTSASDQNIAIGVHSLYAHIGGSNNTAVGSFTTIGVGGTNNTVLGYQASTSGPEASSSSANASTISNTIVLGNSAVTALKCQVQTITALSDERDKTNIKPLTVGRSFIDKLSPVSFDWNMRDGGKIGIPAFGFIAQDLQKIQQEENVTVPDLIYDMNPNRLEAAYSALLPSMVLTIQQLSTEIKQLQEKIQQLELQIDKR